MERALLFWGVCIPIRTAIALEARRGNELLRLAAAGVAYTWLSGTLTNTHGAFGGYTWWREERRKHGALWAAYSLSGDWRFLAADVAYGATNWLSTCSSCN